MIQRLNRALHEKVWGSVHTSPWAENTEPARKLGEIWFEASDSIPLLVKLLFTSEKLSVQVHPTDEYAKKKHNSRGKTEMWHILRAEAGAEIALGLKQRVTPEELREASLTGMIEQLLNWVPAHPGDTFFVPASTIHAIGGGLVLCEVQQHSDVTYRLYDYGRPRELHLDDGCFVSNCEAHDAGEVELPVNCDYFHTDCMQVRGSVELAPRDRNTIYVALQGEGTIAGEPFRAGEAFEVTAGSAVSIQSAEASFLFTEARSL